MKRTACVPHLIGVCVWARASGCGAETGNGFEGTSLLSVNMPFAKSFAGVSHFRAFLLFCAPLCLTRGMKRDVGS